MHWYMAANERALDIYHDHIVVALRSARAHTTLKPFLIYSGEDSEKLAVIEALGATVIRHDVPFLSRLLAKKRVETRPHFKIEIASGAYLRTSLPLLETKEEVVLYTDVDVMFLRDVSFPEFDEPLLASSEFVVGDRSYFNSGVMAMNLPKLRASYSEFLDFMIEKDFAFAAYDQGAYNEFYKSSWGFIDETHNWKPYLGPNPDAKVIHFHGPKIWTIRDLCDRGESPGSPDHHLELFEKHPDEYRRLREAFERHLSADQRLQCDPLTRPRPLSFGQRWIRKLRREN